MKRVWSNPASDRNEIQDREGEGRNIPNFIFPIPLIFCQCLSVLRLSYCRWHKSNGKGIQVTQSKLSAFRAQIKAENGSGNVYVQWGNWKNSAQILSLRKYTCAQMKFVDTLKVKKLNILMTFKSISAGYIFIFLPNPDFIYTTTYQKSSLKYASQIQAIQNRSSYLPLPRRPVPSHLFSFLLT